MKKIIFIIFLSFFISAQANSTISSFSKSKKILKKIYKGHQTTFYAQCKYNYKNKNNMIDREK